SVRVPLIVAEPGQTQSRRVDAPVSLIDLAPTVMDYATAEASWQPAAAIDGQTLKPLLRGEAGARDAVISEYTGEGGCAPCRMVRKGDFKLIYTHGFPDLLYDIRNDPLEVNNLGADPRHAATRATLRRDLLAGWDPDAINRRVLQSQRERRLIQTATG